MFLLIKVCITNVFISCIWSPQHQTHTVGTCMDKYILIRRGRRHILVCLQSNIQYSTSNSKNPKLSVFLGLSLFKNRPYQVWPFSWQPHCNRHYPLLVNEQRDRCVAIPHRSCHTYTGQCRGAGRVWRSRCHYHL